MKRSIQIVTLMLLVAGFAFVGAGCQSDGDKVESATTAPDHPKGEHPTGDHPKGEHPE